MALLIHRPSWLDRFAIHRCRIRSDRPPQKTRLHLQKSLILLQNQILARLENWSNCVDWWIGANTSGVGPTMKSYHVGKTIKNCHVGRTIKSSRTNDQGLSDKRPKAIGKLPTRSKVVTLTNLDWRDSDREDGTPLLRCAPVKLLPASRGGDRSSPASVRGLGFPW